MRKPSNFEIYLRTGRRIDLEPEVKFNHRQDPKDGRFTFADQGGIYGGGSTSTSERSSRTVASKRPGSPKVRSHAAMPIRIAPRRSGLALNGMSPNAPSRRPASTTASKPDMTSVTSAPNATLRASALGEPRVPESIRIDDIPPAIRNHPNYNDMLLLPEPGINIPLKAPDGAFYVLPKKVDDAYITRAINHLSSVDSHVRRLIEFKKCILIRRILILDFKRFGTAEGPKGYPSIAPIEYYSTAAGKIVRASPFEPAGNSSTA